MYLSFQESFRFPKVSQVIFQIHCMEPNLAIDERFADSRGIIG